MSEPPSSQSASVSKKTNWNVNAHIRGALRRIFVQSPILQEVMREARRQTVRFNKDGTQSKKYAVEYQCALCKNWFPQKLISVDHKVPVVNIDDGFVDWNTFIERLFCDKSLLQCVCDDCHNKKTQSERISRLFKKYSEELDWFENKINTDSDFDKKSAKKFLSKYIAKKKVKGLEGISKRASELKEKL